MSVWLPVMYAKDSNPKRGLRRMVHGLVVFNVFYVFAVLEIYPRMSH